MFTGGNLSFTTTALVRPDILAKTYESYSRNLGGLLGQCHLFLNIDRVPDDENGISETITVAKFFFKEVIWHVGKIPNYALALKWCWQNADTDFIFNLEDDWILSIPFDPMKAWNKFAEDSKVIQIALRGGWWPYDKFTLNPSFIIRRAYKTFGDLFTEDKNPEVQTRNHPLFPVTSEMFFAFGVGNTSEPISIDIGREWTAHHRLHKLEPKYNFITYQEV